MNYDDFGEDIWTGDMPHVEEESYPFNSFGAATPPAFNPNIFASVMGTIGAGMGMVGNIANAAGAGAAPTVAAAPVAPVAAAAPPVVAAVAVAPAPDVPATGGPGTNTNMIIGIAAAALGIPLLIMAVRK
jgi:hypothetical protein